MIIGLDGGALSITDDRLKVGVYKVTLRLLEELSALKYSNNYRIYSFIPVGESILKKLGNLFENRVVTPKTGWQKLWLPLELKLHPVDLFLGLSQSIPLFSSHNIGFIYDLGFLHIPWAYRNSATKLKIQTENLIHKSDHIITISNAVKQDIINNYKFPKSKISVAYPGIDPIFHNNQTKFQNPKPYFLVVGALKPGKNIPMIIKAFHNFLIYSDIKYDLILAGGDYWKDPKIEQTIKELNLQDSVKKLGYTPDENLVKLYRSSTALLVPSFWEGFCLPAVEAMACGCPVIGSNTGALTEVTGGNGIFFNPDNILAATNAIMEIVKPIVRLPIINNGKILSQRYTWHNFTNEVFGVMTNIGYER
jgi:glycosyltransferase involved in cell wall biosynthesis